jgi:ribosomal protein S27E
LFVNWKQDHDGEVLLEMRFLHTRHDVWDGPTTRRAMWQFILAGGAGAVWGRIWGEDSPPYDARTVEQLRCFARFWRDRWQLDLWRLLEQHFETFQQVYDERFAARYGFWRPVVERSVKAILKCGDLHEGFARVRCPDCHHEMFVAFSCKQRCTCPSCHQKRARPGVPGAPTSIHVAEEVCAPVAHRQVVLTIPKRLRLHTRFDRQLLGKLCTCAWTFPDADARGAGNLPLICRRNVVKLPQPAPKSPQTIKGGWRVQGGGRRPEPASPP